MAVSSASSASSSSRQVKHQVFLSFRGPDTRHGFTSHLLQVLKDKGINVFFDEETLEKGEVLSQALLSGIAKSQIAIIVLSKDYASSKSCLAELFEIMHYKRSQGQVVVPIFYHVNPSDVRDHGGSFKKSFDEHHQSNRPDNQLQRWKDAFAEVGKLSGWHIEGGNFDRSEPEYIKVIVDDVIKKLNNKSKSGFEEFVGINYQKEMILKFINGEDTRAIGIWGMGGIGKTILAEAVYNEINPTFADHCFLLNVREKIEKNGMEKLRNEFLSKLLKQKIHIETPCISSTFTQERLGNQRVFVVLDDVNDSDQIECLGVKHFGHGSKILVTSRDQQVLKNGVDKIYEVQKLNDEDSLQLFSKFAFKQLNPIADLRDLSKKCVDYAGGLPLALKVLGGSLFQKPREIWESALDKLKEYPNQSILKVLQISFDGLDEVEKNIFLDIAFFFKGEHKDYATNVLSGCYAGAQFGISNLVDKCLLDLSPFGQLSMHDLLEEMGRGIVRQESINDPGKRSRLWNPKDVHEVFQYNMGTKSIKGIILSVTQIDSTLQLSLSSFEKMIHLKILKIYYDLKHYDEWRKQANQILKWADYYESLSSKFILRNQALEYLPDELRCFWWDHCPLKSLPSKFNPKNLVALRITRGKIEQLWNEDHQDLVNLREIDVSYCKNLRKIPNLLGAIKLKVLRCNGCESLEELPSLNHLTSLLKLEFVANFNLKKFPEIPGDFTDDLDLENTKIEEVPDSIELLFQLRTLRMSKSRVNKVSSKISKLESLWCLNFSYCPIEELPSSIWCLNKLRFLYLRGTKIQNLPSNISKLDALSYLDLSECPNITEINFGPSAISGFKSLHTVKMSHCKSLKLVSEIPMRLVYLIAHGCTSLEKVLFSFEFHRYNHSILLIFSDCFELNLDFIDNIACNILKAHEYLIDKIAPSVRCCLPVNKNFNRFEHQSMNSSITLEISPNTCSGITRFLVFTLCFVIEDTLSEYVSDILISCEGRLMAKGGAIYKDFKSKFEFRFPEDQPRNGQEMHVVFDKSMVHYDMNNYEKAAFKFQFITEKDYTDDDDGESVIIFWRNVNKCGVHITYVEKDHNGCSSTTIMEPEQKRKFGYDGKGGGGSKRFR